MDVIRKALFPMLAIMTTIMMVFMQVAIVRKEGVLTLLLAICFTALLVATISSGIRACVKRDSIEE